MCVLHDPLCYIRVLIAIGLSVSGIDFQADWLCGLLTSTAYNELLCMGAYLMECNLFLETPVPVETSLCVCVTLVGLIGCFLLGSEVNLQVS